MNPIWGLADFLAVGLYLYHACVVYTTILVALNSITTEQVNITQATAKSVTQILNYASTHSEAITRYNYSGMSLHVHSNASFLSEP